MVVVLAMAHASDAPERPVPVQAPHPCRECSWGDCTFRIPRVRAYIIAYCEAIKCGDDPAEYIRDSIKPSRPTCPPCHRPDPTEPSIFAQNKTRNRTWHVDVKVSLERARDIGGLSLDAWNAPRVAAWLCSRADEG